MMLSFGFQRTNDVKIIHEQRNLLFGQIMSGSSFLLVERSTRKGFKVEEQLNLAIGKQLEEKGM